MCNTAQLCLSILEYTDFLIYICNWQGVLCTHYDVCCACKLRHVYAHGSAIISSCNQCSSNLVMAANLLALWYGMLKNLDICLWYVSWWTRAVIHEQSTGHGSEKGECIVGWTAQVGDIPKWQVLSIKSNLLFNLCSSGKGSIKDELWHLNITKVGDQAHCNG